MSSESSTSSGPGRRARGDRTDVAIATGAGGNLGRLLVQSLHRKMQVVAVDRRPIRGLPKDVRHLRTDVRWRAIEDVFRTSRVRAIVHLGLMHNPRAEEDHYRFNVVGTQRLLELAAKYSVDTFVMVSSANIYGPDPDNSYFLNEDTPLLGAEHHPDIRDLVACDRLVQNFFYRHADIRTMMLRPVHIVGPRVRNAPSNYLRLERPWVITGFDPMIQLIHEEDLVRAVMVAIEGNAKGIFNVVGPGEAPLSRVLEVLERRTRSLPSFAFRALLDSAWALRATGFPPPEIRHVQYNCIVDGAAFRTATGFQPAHTLTETILSVRDMAL